MSCARASRRAAAKPFWRSALKAFSLSGRLSVIVSTAPARLVRIGSASSCVGGGGVGGALSTSDIGAILAHSGHRVARTVRLACFEGRKPRVGGARLAAAELGWALLEECVQAFLRVVRGERQVQRAALVLEAEREWALVRAVDGVLREPDADRSLRRDRPGDALRLVQPRLLCHHA